MSEENENINQKNSKCCLNCKFFEERSGFCRLNPPQPINVKSKNGTFVTSIYPKIGFPKFDYCYQFEETKNDNEK